ncbi:MAG: response regulator [Planctomycetia bacterium]|nr:response regulator [Planctomycetia bacterium]
MSTPTPPAAGVTRPRLLVVDDALIMRMRIAAIAREAGWDVAGEAADGAEGLSRYRELRPDLVTLDIVMPTLDGVETLRSIMAEDPQARVVMVSAVDQRSKLVECIELGALDFIVKPFDKPRLTALFERYAGRPPA